MQQVTPVSPARSNGTQPGTHRITGSSEMAECIRTCDWSRTPLGPIDAWSPTLLTAVNLILASPTPMQLFWGPESIVLYNDAAVPIFTDKHPKALGMPGRECWAEAWATAAPLLHKVRSTGQPVSFPAALVPINRNGVFEDAWWDFSYSAVYGLDGQIEGVLEPFRDVTEAVRTAAAKRESDERLELALEGAGLGMWFYDPETGIVHADDRMHRIFGSPDPVGTPEYWLNLVHPEDRSRVAEHFAGAVAGKHPYDIEYRIAYPDGIRWVRTKGRLFGEEGQPKRLAAIIEDITGRKSIESALVTSERNLRASQGEAIRSEQQLQDITDSLPSFIAYIDPSFRYQRVNRAFETRFRRTAAEMLGRTMDEVLTPELNAIIRPHLRQALAGKRQHFEYTLTEFGEERSIAATHIPDIDPTGHVRGIIIQAQDITDRKRTEKALIQTEKLAAVGRLSASIAHEINNPLEAVTNLLFLARHSEDTPTTNEYLDLAERELRRVSAISHQTLRFYRQSTRPRLVSCEELIESVLSIYQGRLINSHIRVEADRCMHHSVECFDGEIRQVLNNLVSNAIDAMHPNGGRLLIRSRNATDGATGRKGVTLTVADTGLGMPPQVLANIFQAFYTTKGIGGTGLGLWVSKEIIDRHHGTLRIRSSQDPTHSGTVCQLFLPLEAVSR